MSQTLKDQPSMDELIQLSETAALRTFADARNARVLFRLLLFFTAVSVVLALVLLAESRYAFLVVPATNLLLIRVLFLLRERPFFARHCQSIVVTFLVVQPLLLLVFSFAYLPEESYPPLVFFLPFLVLFFRLPPGSLAVPLGLLWGLSAGRNLVEASLTDAEISYGGLVGMSVIVLVTFSIVSSLTRKRRLAFLIDWRREHRRHRERLRMREELDDARKIQLSMLPRHDPRLPWLDVASISIPASEVGGDYYDFFALDDERQAVVVGDVAGHGVASGLLLAAVRACLYLLHEAPLPPVETLRKIDRVVRQTSGKRQFITLLYALFDRERHTLSFSAAGHPPLLRFRPALGQAEELSLDALPLGIGLEPTLEQRSETIEPGDVYLAYTDGIAETTNLQGEVYGNERLLHRLRQTPFERSAKEVRDTLLGDVWSFKGDAEQTDDITLVVIKVL